MQIQPDLFDLVVVGSGLPECLVASSAIRSGKSVLIIDAVDTYGTDWASFTLASLQQAAAATATTATATSLATSKHTTGEAAGSALPGFLSSSAHAANGGAQQASIPATVNCEQAAGLHQQSGSLQVFQDKDERAHAPRLDLLKPLPGGVRRLDLPQPQLPLQSVRMLAPPAGHTTAGTEDTVETAMLSSIGDSRSYILDLAPKAVYQAESLVDLLVGSRAHNYVEFKLLEGSCILQGGRLVAVPASKADIFKDKAMSLSDKRQLMRFISNCMGAAQGGGSLQAVLSSTTPLLDVLQAEGLSSQLQDIVLYAIAMAEYDQRPAACTTSTATSATASAPVCRVDQPEGALASVPTAAVTGPTSSPAHMSSHMVTATAGAAALQLLTESMGRFGSPGAFMVPSYGCGSLPEAFVRHAAVHGAVTVLRQPVQALVVDDAVGDGLGPSTCRGIITNAGQYVRCSALLAGASTLRHLYPPADSSTKAKVQRALLILDGSLVEGKSCIAVVLPPHAPGVGNAHAVRGLQIGPNTCATPSGRYLLYLSTPGCTNTTDAQTALHAAVDALVNTATLQSIRQPLSTHGSTPHTACSPTHSRDANVQHDKAASRGDSDGLNAPATTSLGSDTTSSGSSKRPNALCLFYYEQCDSGMPNNDLLPANIGCCGGPDHLLAGYGNAIAGARAVCSKLLPDVTWLASINAKVDEAGEGQEGAEHSLEQAGSDDEAIDELQAAMAGLQQQQQS